MTSTSAPTTSWFSAPEGLYTLVQSLNSTAVVGDANFLGSSTRVVSSTGVAPIPISLEPTPIPPPPHDSRISIVTIKYPSKESSGLGLMSMGSLRPRVRENSGDSAIGLSTSPTSLTSPGLISPLLNGNGGFNMTPSLSQGSSAREELDSPGGGGAPLVSLPSTGGSTTPLFKKKPLSSSFSSNSDTSSRPLRPFRGNSSTFVRSWEGLPLTSVILKGLAEGNVGKDAVFAFYTLGKGIVWSELVPGRPKDHLCKVTFAVPPTCIDVCQATASHQQLDVLIGFATGDIFWFDPLTAKYTRLNKAGIVTPSAITSIKWLPPSPSSYHHNYFVSSHADGTMVIWDKSREDCEFVPTPAPSASLEGPAGMGNLLVTRSTGGTDKKGVSMTKFNPVSHWRVSKTAVKDFSFSPDGQFCAVVGDDGCLRIIDTALELLLETFAGYFGSLRTVSWSPDGRFVVTGGQDDLCTVYAPLEQRLVARCQGHSSFVTGVAWDPWRSDETTLRFGSVSEDCKLILWDLSSAALSRPKTHHGVYNHRHSTSSYLSPPADEDLDFVLPSYHPAPLRSDVAILEPIMMKVLSQNDLFSSLIFLPNFLVTLSRTGAIKVFDRPPVDTLDGGLGNLRSEFAASEVRIDTRAR